MPLFAAAERALFKDLYSIKKRRGEQDAPPRGRSPQGEPAVLCSWIIAYSERLKARLDAREPAFWREQWKTQMA